MSDHKCDPTGSAMTMFIGLKPGPDGVWAVGLLVIGGVRLFPGNGQSQTIS